jgi:flagellar assembly factor FliW
VIIETTRFGNVQIKDEDVIEIPNGILGFSNLTRYCLIDAGDETLILWLQSLDDPHVAFAVLEPKIFKPDYIVKLSANELKELGVEKVSKSAVFSILTIPSDVTQMSANIKAPVVINLEKQIARQVILQENDYSLKHPMFKELRAHLLTIEAQAKRTNKAPAAMGSVAIDSLSVSAEIGNN